MSDKKVVRISKDGVATFLYDDRLKGLMAEGKTQISRASTVEPDPENPSTWVVDLTVSGGPIRKGFTTRGEALEWEVKWLNANQLGQKKDLPVRDKYGDRLLRACLEAGIHPDLGE